MRNKPPTASVCNNSLYFAKGWDWEIEEAVNWWAARGPPGTPTDTAPTERVLVVARKAVAASSHAADDLVNPMRQRRNVSQMCASEGSNSPPAKRMYQISPVAVIVMDRDDGSALPRQKRL